MINRRHDLLPITLINFFPDFYLSNKNQEREQNTFLSKLHEARIFPNLG